MILLDPSAFGPGVPSCADLIDASLFQSPFPRLRSIHTSGARR